MKEVIRKRNDHGREQVVYKWCNDRAWNHGTILVEKPSQ